MAQSFAHIKPYVIGGLFLIWAGVFISSLVRNPGLTEAKAQEAMIKGDLPLLLKHGGRVLSSTSNAKYGSVYTVYNMSAEGWSDKLLQKYDGTLVALNWRRLPSRPYRYCKEGVHAKLESNAGMLDKQAFNRIAFEFNAGTIKLCKAAPSRE